MATKSLKSSLETRDTIETILDTLNILGIEINTKIYDKILFICNDYFMFHYNSELPCNKKYNNFSKRELRKRIINKLPYDIVHTIGGFNKLNTIINYIIKDIYKLYLNDPSKKLSPNYIDIDYDYEYDTYEIDEDPYPLDKKPLKTYCVDFKMNENKYSYMNNFINKYGNEKYWRNIMITINNINNHSKKETDLTRQGIEDIIIQLFDIYKKILTTDIDEFLLHNKLLDSLKQKTINFKITDCQLKYIELYIKNGIISRISDYKEYTIYIPDSYVVYDEIISGIKDDIDIINRKFEEYETYIKQPCIKYKINKMKNEKLKEENYRNHKVTCDICEKIIEFDGTIDIRELRFYYGDDGEFYYNKYKYDDIDDYQRHKVLFGVCNKCYEIYNKIHKNEYDINEYIINQLNYPSYHSYSENNINYLLHKLVLCYIKNSLFPIINYFRELNQIIQYDSEYDNIIFVIDVIPYIIKPFIDKYFNSEKDSNNRITQYVNTYISHFELLKSINYKKSIKTVFSTFPSNNEYIIPFSTLIYNENIKLNILNGNEKEITTLLLCINRFDIHDVISKGGNIIKYKSKYDIPYYEYEMLPNELVIMILERIIILSF